MSAYKVRFTFFFFFFLFGLRLLCGHAFGLVAGLPSRLDLLLQAFLNCSKIAPKHLKKNGK